MTSINVLARKGRPHARTQTDLRELQHGAASRVARSAHLQLRVHLLRDLCRRRAGERLPELRRRIRSPAREALEELEGRQFPRERPCEYPGQAQAGRCRSSRSILGHDQSRSASPTLEETRRKNHPQDHAMFVVRRSSRRRGESGREFHGKPPGTVMTVAFELDGQSFTALNGGPMFKFNEAISLQINCETQEEVDDYWEKPSSGGDKDAQQCGWLKDRYGVSWQVVPAVL